MFEYKCTVDRVVDGDTVDLWVDLGFHIKVHERFRLYGINAPESRTKDLKEKLKGIESTKFLVRLLDDMKGDLVVTTLKDKQGKYGRWIGTLWMDMGESTEMNINKEMVAVGHAAFQDY